MKMAFIIPEDYYSACKKAADSFEGTHEVEFCFYKDYKEAPFIIDGRQKRWDGILFAGKAPYYYSLKKIKKETVWSFFPSEESTFLRALILAFNQGFGITDLSVDSYHRKMVEGALSDIGISCGRDVFSIYRGDVTTQAYNDHAVEFHIKEIEKEHKRIVITRLNTVEKILKGEGVRTIHALPTFDMVRSQIIFLQKLVWETKGNLDNYLMIAVEVQITAENAMMYSDEYQRMIHRNNILTYIYEYAQKLQGVVSEISQKEVHIITQKKFIEVQENIFDEFELLNHLTARFPYTFKIGIGSGSTLLETKRRAMKAAMRVAQYEGSNAYYLFGEDAGQFILPSVNEVKEYTGDEQLLYIARQCGFNVETVYRIQMYLHKKQKNIFTSKELAEHMKINIRSMNRILEKLEEKGFVNVIGQEIAAGKKGRPGRLLKFDI